MMSAGWLRRSSVLVAIVVLAAACGGESSPEVEAGLEPEAAAEREAAAAEPAVGSESGGLGVSGGDAAGEGVLEARYFERLAEAVASLDDAATCPGVVLPESFDDVVEVGRIAGGCLLFEYVVLGGRSVGEVRVELAADPSVFAVGVPPVDLEPLQSGGLSDVASSPQWHLEPMGAEFLWRPGGWEHQVGAGPWVRVPGWPAGARVVVAVIDDGVDGSHRDLTGSLLDPDSLPASVSDAGLSCHRSPKNDHGTHVAGIIAATRGNGVDVAGLAPEATILPIRIHYTADFADRKAKTGPDSQACFDSVPTLTHAINLARRAGADVINMSLRWGTREFELGDFEDVDEFVTPGVRTETVALAIDVARQKNNIVVVAAAGNCGDDRIYERLDLDDDGQLDTKANGDPEWYLRADQSDTSGSWEPGWKVIDKCKSHHVSQRPASISGVIAVAATDVYDTGDTNIARAVFSTSNHTVDVAAPGTGILSTVRGGTASWNGTSMAAPIVSAAVAHIKARFPTATPTAIEDALTTTASNHPNRTDDLGFGVIDPLAAIEYLNALVAGPGERPGTIPDIGFEPAVSIAAGAGAQGAPGPDGTPCAGADCRYVEITLTDAPDGDYTVECYSSANPTQPWQTATWHWPNDTQWTQGGCAYDTPGDQVWVTVTNPYGSLTTEPITWPTTTPPPQPEPTPPAGGASISAGSTHTCALRNDNTITCWGLFGDGQAEAPGGVYSAVSAGGNHSCGLRSDGTITCWGASDSGQTVAPGGVFSAVSAGGDHSCGLRSDGTITCWGANFDGQSEAPGGVFSAISAGWEHSCGLRSDGTITCWGWNEWGQAEAPGGVFSAVSAGGGHSCGLRSDGTITCWGHSSSAPGGVFGAVSAGRWHACGLRSDGTITCWGHSRYGMASAPGGVFSAVSAGGQHSCGLRSDGTITCWGHSSSAPGGVFGAVSAGGAHSCGLRSDGIITCWGASDSGQTVAPGGAFGAVSAGWTHSCGLRSDGTITCWGDNYYGQTEAPGGVFSAVSAGLAHSCGLRSDGTITCWDHNYYGTVEAPEGAFSAVSAGGEHSCGLRSDGTITCWGDNGSGEAAAPGGVFSAVSAGGSHSCGLRSDGTITCWGASDSGQTDAPGGVFSAVSAGGQHSCGLRSDGTITCWGSSDSGQTDAPGGVFSAVSAGADHSCGSRSDGTITCWGSRAVDLRGGGGAQEPIVEPTPSVGGSVVLSRGGPGPTSVGEGQGVPCAPDSPTCRNLDVTLAGFAPGTYTVSCAHDGWGEYGPSVFWTFSIAVDAGGSAVSRGPCFLNFARLTGTGAYVTVTGPDNTTVNSNWLK